METDTASTPIPVASLKYDAAGDGTFYAQLTVIGLKSEQQAQAAAAYIERLFLGQELEVLND